jgi:4'-phosphopantetheinyl transferase
LLKPLHNPDGGSAWRASHVHLSLAEGEVHVWCAVIGDAKGHPQTDLSLMVQDEQERAARFRFPADRARFILCRCLLRTILGRYAGLSPAELRFHYGPHGKPALVTTPGMKSLHFNLSHTSDIAVIAVARNVTVGIDVEQLRPLPDIENLAAAILGPSEWATWQGLAPSERLSAFYRCWTRKEAFVKATGQGLSMQLQEVDAAMGEELPLHVRVAGRTSESARWTLQPLPPIPGHAAALCVEGSAANLACWTAS